MEPRMPAAAATRALTVWWRLAERAVAVVLCVTVRLCWPAVEFFGCQEAARRIGEAVERCAQDLDRRVRTIARGPCGLRWVLRGLGIAEDLAVVDKADGEKVRACFLEWASREMRWETAEAGFSVVEEVVGLALRNGVVREAAAVSMDSSDMEMLCLEELGSSGSDWSNDQSLNGDGGNGSELSRFVRDWQSRRPSDKAFFERKVSRALLNASLDKVCRKEIATKGGAPVVIELLQSEDQNVRICSCIALGRIAKFCSVEMLSDAIHQLVELLRFDSGASPSVHDHDHELAAFAVSRLARRSDSLCAAIAGAGTLPVLLDLLTHSNGRLQRVAIEAVRELVVYSDANQGLWVQIGGLASILQLVTCSDGEVKLYAAEILGALATMKEVRRAIVSMSKMPALVEAARVGHMTSRTRAAHALGLLAFTKRVRRTIVDADAIPILIDLLRNGDTLARLVSGNALAILSAHVDHLRLVSEVGAIPLFVDLLEENDPLGKEIAEDAFCILAVSEDNAVMIVDHLVRVLHNSSISSRAAAADIIWDLSSYKHSIPVIRASGAIPLLVGMLKEENEEARGKASGALAQLSYDENDRKAMAEVGIIPVLVNLLKDISDEAKENAAEALHNFAKDSLYEAEMTETCAIPALIEFEDTSSSGSRARENSDHAAVTLQYVSLRQFV